MKRHEFKVTFENKYYSIVRTIVDYFRRYNPLGIANGKEPFNSGILVDEDDNNTTIWFQVRKGKLNYDLCKGTIHDLENLGIIKIEEES